MASNSTPSRYSRRLLCLLVVASSPLPTQAADHRLNGHRFTLPDGFTIELAAGEPQTLRPITGALDEKGRLYVAESSGSNDPVQKQLQDLPHRILRLEDTDHDGRFDRSSTFADRMMFPEGTMWFQGSLYVAAPPRIWKLTDRDDDGVADLREVWFDGKTLTGCANDLHGPYEGLDGRIYWCKGAFAEQTYPRQGKPPLVTRAAHIFRALPDATSIEPVMNGGMDNPVDVVFTPSGERIFTTTFLVHPGNGLRDGLIHAIHGGVHGKVHEPILAHPWTSPEVMPVLSHLGPAAPAGLARYESDAFGAEYQDNLFACLFNLHKITRHVLRPDGSTLSSTDTDFLTSDRLDFHPTDVIEDADGSLLVIDTGGWYKLCCPTSQLHKPDVHGAIYRIRRTGAPSIRDPRGLELSWDHVEPAQLVQRLDDPRPVVRRGALGALGRLGATSVPSIVSFLRSNEHSGSTRALAVWALTRIDDPAARAAVREELDAKQELVREAALNSVSLWRDGKAAPRLAEFLDSGSMTVRRLSAEALGRIGDAAAVPALLESSGRVDLDRGASHAVTYALIEIEDRDQTRVGLSSASPRVRQTALTALEMMPGGGSRPEQIETMLSSDDPIERRTAIWIAGRHPDWGSALIGVIKQWLSTIPDDPTARDELAARVAVFASSPEIQELLAELLSSPTSTGAKSHLALESMSRASFESAPSLWAHTLSSLLANPGAVEPPSVLRVIRSLEWNDTDGAEIARRLTELAEAPETPVALRLEALASCPRPGFPLADSLFATVLARLAPDEDVSRRTLAVDCLSKAELTEPQQLLLAEGLAQAGPLEFNRLLAIFERSRSETVGLKLVEGLSRSPALANLRPEDLQVLLDRHGERVKDASKELLRRMSAARDLQTRKLEELSSGLTSGDIRRGQEVFHSEKAACSSCHAIGYLGGKVGPDLTRIGQIRSERDLLEAIVFPSASFVRSYEPMLVATTDGRVVNGLLKLDSPGEVVLTVDATKEIHIARQDIEEMKPGSVSVMPAGLDQQLSARELTDLVTFLKANR